MTTRKMNPKVAKLENQAARKRVDEHLKKGEKIELKTWHNHVDQRNEIASFTSIAGDKLYFVEPRKDEIFLPFYEYHGDHSENWIIAVDVNTNVEIFRKSTKTVDMVNWKLPSSEINNEENGKKSK